MSNEMISVAEAAEKLEVHRTRINQLIDTGQLPATRIGRAYAIRVADLDLVKDRPAVGRPKKEGEAQGAAEASPPVPTPAKLTATKKKAIAEEQQRRWRNETPGKKATKKGGKK